MKKFIFIAAIATLMGTAGANAMEPANYKITVNANWTAQSHPLDHPGNAHFSGIIGTAHSGKYTLFSDGGTATQGLENLSEKGSHKPLDKEIKQAVSAGFASELFESGALFSFPGKLEASVSTDDRYPYLSFVAMIAPSPDWFTGVSKMPLKDDGKWISSATFTLWAWDAGTDFGKTFASANADAMPRQSTRIASSAHFLGSDGLKPVGTVTITRTDITASN